MLLIKHGIETDAKPKRRSFINLENREKIEQMVFTAKELVNAPRQQKVL
ncbi:MAG: hypothetical protein WBD27_18140 [Pyrinomonadaceae bacterium]